VQTQNSGSGTHIQTDHLVSQPNNPKGTGPANTQVTEAHNQVTRSLKNEGNVSALRNNTFAAGKGHDAGFKGLASKTFEGRLADFKDKDRDRFTGGDWFWRHRHPIIVIGWYGPLFWPYAYWDFVDYTFWPYAYDVFWPYAYDDLYVGLFGPYSYEGPYYSGTQPTARRRVANAKSSAAVCQEQVSALAAWPIQQIAQTVQPDATQQAALDALKDATSSALSMLQSACPNDLPSTPTGRLVAMRQRIEVMAQAVATIKPALDHFYEVLSDEQKARFNPIKPEVRLTSTRAANAPPDLAQVCSGRAARPVAAPSERIARVLHPTDAQQAALRALDDATAKAADYLKANCSAEETLTPPGRLAAMEQRLNAMLDAIKIVQPALEDFYGSLTDEQKARFNQLGGAQS
jgi:hypothetical protein